MTQRSPPAVPARFPAGTGLTRTLPDVDAFSYVLVMTHNFLRDSEYLAAVLNGQPHPQQGYPSPWQQPDRWTG
jgi:hypothetical protein